VAKSRSARRRGQARTRAAGASRGGGPSGGGSGKARPGGGSAASSETRARTSPARTVSPAARGRPGNGAGRQRVRYTETTGRDWRRSLAYIVLFVGSVVVAFTVVAPRRGPVLAALLVLVTLWLLVGWHSRGFAYRCANCRRVFQVPAIVNFLSFQGVSRRPDGTYRGWKSLTCPYCHQRTKATVVRRLDDERRPRAKSPGSDAPLLR
jgi:hypothetical protein